jgi:hypothetical protein
VAVVVVVKVAVHVLALPDLQADVAVAVLMIMQPILVEQAHKAVMVVLEGASPVWVVG